MEKVGAEQTEVLRERLARAICEADKSAPDPNSHILLGMKPAKAWEARLPMAEAALTVAAEYYEARIADLQTAMIEAVVPLEALRWSGSDRNLSPDLQEGIRAGVNAVRAVLAKYAATTKETRE